MNPADILESCFLEALDGESPIDNPEIRQKVESICRCLTNKAPIRFLMACLLAKIHRPNIDIRKPYTEIGGDDSYSGRTYDEAFVGKFIADHNLPCRPTTAFLTPAFRNIDRLLTPELVLVGNPKEIYTFTLQLLDKVHGKEVEPYNLLQEILRQLLIIQTENESRMQQLLAGLNRTDDDLPLSSEQIVTLLQQHLACKNSSRLPVLITAAAYQTVRDFLNEEPSSLKSHNAADKQTGAIGDVEIALVNDEKLVTCYEMKDKRVTIGDLNHALSKVADAATRIDNYIFITTDVIEQEVVEHARTIYDRTGIEMVVLDCIGFIRHFLHFFHRHRLRFLNTYQDLVLNEADSSVSQPLKEAFLILRKAAEAD